VRTLANFDLFLESAALACYADVFLLVVHVYVMSYEEPTLEDKVGIEHDGYPSRVPIWCPTVKRRTGQPWEKRYRGGDQRVVLAR
jgi:hypothetical protein